MELKLHIDISCHNLNDFFRAMGQSRAEVIDSVSKANTNDIKAVEEHLKEQYHGDEYFILVDDCLRTGEIRARVYKKPELRTDSNLSPITVNSGRVGDLRRYLNRFPDDAKIVIQSRNDLGYYKLPLSIGCNFEHQKKTNEVLVFSASGVEKKYD